MKYVNVLKAAKKLEFEAKKIQQIVDDYNCGKNPLQLERNTIEELVNTAKLAKYGAYAVEGAILAINKEIPEYEFVSVMRGIQTVAALSTDKQQ
jgi:predicted Mrr-cat superfamily restriction endonuclease